MTRGLLAFALGWSALTVTLLGALLPPEPPWMVAAAGLATGWVCLAGLSAWQVWRTADRRWAALLTFGLCMVDLPLLIAPEGPLLHVLRARHTPDEPGPPSTARLVARALWDAFDAGDVHLVMFIGIGWAAGYVRRGHGEGVAAGLIGAAVAAEAMQTLAIDRIVALDDVRLNLTGALIGLATARAAQVRRG